MQHYSAVFCSGSVITTFPDSAAYPLLTLICIFWLCVSQPSVVYLYQSSQLLLEMISRSLIADFLKGQVHHVMSVVLFQFTSFILVICARFGLKYNRIPSIYQDWNNIAATSNRCNFNGRTCTSFLGFSTTTSVISLCCLLKFHILKVRLPACQACLL